MLLWTGLVWGFLGSMHCIGMCGPLAMSVPVKNSLWNSISLYQLGRLMSYATLGASVGLIGWAISSSGFQNYLSIVSGALIITMVLLPVVLKKTGSAYTFHIAAVFPKPLKNALGKLYKQKTDAAALGIGILNGLLPCGLVYYALAGALAMGNVYLSSVYMLLFGIGTLPALTAIMIVKNKVAFQYRQTIFKTIPYFTVLIGMLLILRGMNLGIPYVSPYANTNSDKPFAQKCH
jgi:uncharacterized protein